MRQWPAAVVVVALLLLHGTGALAAENGPSIASAGEELYASGRYVESLQRLESALAAEPDDDRALLFAGLVHARLGDPAKAAALWKRFEQKSKDRALAAEVGRMRTILLRQAAEDAAREAVATEKRIGVRAADPRTVAVARFRNAGSAEYAPLGKALAAMLIDNLSALPTIRVVERENVQALEQEARLAAGGLVEKATAVRAGKLLRAGRVTAGSHADAASPARLALEAFLVDVDRGDTISSARSEAAPDRFFELVPAIASKFAAALDRPVEQLAPEVRSRVEEPHTRSLDATLAFGRALDDFDRHDVVGAHRLCGEIERLDPRFDLARRWCGGVPRRWLSVAAVVHEVETAALATTAGGGVVVSSSVRDVGLPVADDGAADVYALPLSPAAIASPGCAGADFVCLGAGGLLPPGIISLGPGLPGLIDPSALYLIVFDGRASAPDPLDGYLGLSGADSGRSLLGAVLGNDGDFDRAGGNAPLDARSLTRFVTALLRSVVAPSGRR